MIEFNCTECGTRLRVHDDASGKRGKCPQCGIGLQVPEPETVKLEIVEPENHNREIKTDHNEQTKANQVSGKQLNTRSRATTTKHLKRRKHRWWVILAVLLSLFLMPTVPALALCLGGIIAFLCLLTILPSTRGYSFASSLLCLSPGHPWKNSFRTMLYGFIAVILLAGGYAGTQYKAEQRMIAAQKAAKEFDRRRLAAEANRKVVEIIDKAQDAWLASDLVLADTLINNAEGIEHATDMSPIRRLQSRIANAEVEALIAEAIRKIKIDDLQSAKQLVEDAVDIPYADNLDVAEQLEMQLSLATDSAVVESVLMDLTDDTFLQIQATGEMPDELVSGYEELDGRTARLVQSQLKSVAAARKQRQLEFDERQRAAEEAARKAEQERLAREEAKREAAQKEVRDRLDAYVAILKSAEVSLIDNVSVRRIGDNTWKATLTVDNMWHVRHYQIRLQDAQTLWEVWARIASPDDPDSAIISIVDHRGNEVGGSRVWGGSLIWVTED